MRACAKCGEPSGKARLCQPCQTKYDEARARFYGLDPAPPKICAEEGCNEIIPHRCTFCKPCSRERKLARDRKLKSKVYKEDRSGLKPHRPAPPPQRKPLVDEAEQIRLDALASARDRAWHKEYMKRTLGLTSAPGKPLASAVVTPPPEVWEMIAKSYKPPRENEGDAHSPDTNDRLLRGMLTTKEGEMRERVTRIMSYCGDIYEKRVTNLSTTYRRIQKRIAIEPPVANEREKLAYLRSQISTLTVERDAAFEKGAESMRERVLAVIGRCDWAEVAYYGNFDAMTGVIRALPLKEEV